MYYDIEFIKGQLRKKKVSLSSIARELDVTPSAVTQALQGKEKSKRIIKKVSEVYYKFYELPLPLLENDLAA